MENKNILVACSSLDYILIHKVLHNNFLLDRAENRAEVLSLRQAKSYDLLLIDVAFLKPDFEVIAGAAEENIPVVALSAEPTDAYSGKVRDNGCCACYIKPIRPDLFNSFVSYWIRRYEGKNQECG